MLSRYTRRGAGAPRPIRVFPLRPQFSSRTRRFSQCLVLGGIFLSSLHLVLFLIENELEKIRLVPFVKPYKKCSAQASWLKWIHASGSGFGGSRRSLMTCCRPHKTHSVIQISYQQPFWFRIGLPMAKPFLEQPLHALFGPFPGRPLIFSPNPGHLPLAVPTELQVCTAEAERRRRRFRLSTAGTEHGYRWPPCRRYRHASAVWPALA